MTLYVNKSLSPTSEPARLCLLAAVQRDRAPGGDKGTGRFAAYHAVAVEAFNELIASKPAGIDEAIAWLTDMHICSERLAPNRQPLSIRAHLVESLRKIALSADMRWRDLSADEKAKATSNVARRNARQCMADLALNKRPLRPIGRHRTKMQKQQMLLKRPDADPAAKRVAEINAERDFFAKEIARRKAAASAAAAAAGAASGK